MQIRTARIYLLIHNDSSFTRPKWDICIYSWSSTRRTGVTYTLQSLHGLRNAHLNIKFVSLSYSMPANALTSSNFGLGRYGTQLQNGNANNLALIFPDCENLNRGTNLLNKTLERYHLTVNLDKTKTDNELSRKRVSEIYNTSKRHRH